MVDLWVVGVGDVGCVRWIFGGDGVVDDGVYVGVFGGVCVCGGGGVFDEGVCGCGGVWVRWIGVKFV